MGALEGVAVRLQILGCRTNQYEGEALAFALVEAGARIVEEPPYDAAVLVSCTVTAVADRKGRALLRRFRRECPDAVVAVCGCQAQAMEEGEAHALGIDLLIGNRRKALLPDLLSVRLARPRGDLEVVRGDVADAIWDPLVLGRPMLHTRGFLKVQDGCDHGCSYCIVPSVRGTPVSRHPEDIVAEAEQIVASGCPELIVTGVHLGLYGRGEAYDLGGLVERLGAVPGVRRLRFGSVEPFALDDSLLERLAAVSAFCPHFHVPLQSGDDEVLRRMRRGYVAAEFSRRVGRLRSFFGDKVHVSTDLLVGFPGEDEDAFQKTLALVESLRLGRLHVFPYSPRRGTMAADFPERPSREIARRRCREADALGKVLLGRYAAGFCQEWTEMLVEESGDGWVQGLNPHFLRARLDGVTERYHPGSLLAFRVLFAENGILVGRKV